MKKVIAAWALLLLLILGSFLTAAYMSKSVSELCGILATANYHCYYRHFDKAQTETERYLQALRGNKLYFDLFARKETLQTLYSYSAQLPALIEEDNVSDFIAAANSTAAILLQLADHAWTAL
ncbi:MAG: DUF4363 family protein [Oscillospiraceae bacterium]|nr:DUF4363 family protein [Oscillospiraceae bacterium]